MPGVVVKNGATLDFQDGSSVTQSQQKFVSNNNGGYFVGSDGTFYIPSGASAAQVQSAIGDLPSTGGKIMLLPGTYTWTSGITWASPDVVLHLSMYGAVINANFTGTVISVERVLASSPSRPRGSISGGKIVGQSAGAQSSGVGIYVYATSSEFKIIDTKLYTLGVGLKVVNSYVTTFEHMKALQCGIGFLVQNTPTYNTANTAYVAANPSGVQTGFTYSTTLSFRDCHSSYSQINGLKVTGWNYELSFHTCVFERSVSQDVYITGESGVTNGNQGIYFLNCYVEPDPSGVDKSSVVLIDGGTSNISNDLVVFDGCIFEYHLTTAAGYAAIDVDYTKHLRLQNTRWNGPATNSSAKFAKIRSNVTSGFIGELSPDLAGLGVRSYLIDGTNSAYAGTNLTILDKSQLDITTIQYQNSLGLSPIMAAHQNASNRSILVTGDLKASAFNTYVLGSQTTQWAGTASNTFLVYNASGDTLPMAKLSASSLAFGAANSAADLTLTRNASSDMILTGALAGDVRAGMTGAGLPRVSLRLATGDANHAAALLTDRVAWGPGGASSVDAMLIRTGANALEIQDGAGGYTTTLKAGAFTATTFNGLTITATTGTLTITNGKTLAASDSTTLSTNSITFAGGEVLTLGAAKNVTFADAFTTSGAFALTLTTTAATNVTLPTTGTLATLAGTEALTNKTIGNTNTVTIKDTLFTLQDDGDASKLLAFQLSGITTGTTRTLTIPNASGTLDLIDFAQTVSALKTYTGGATFQTTGLTITDVDIALSATTGTKIGTGATQKLGFYNSTPIVQPSGTGETVGFTAGAGTAVTDQSTFTGNVGATAYRISDIVKALKNLGFLAQ